MAVKVGDKASRTMTVTADHVRAYGEMTGDYNPLHFDEGFASRTAEVVEVHATKPVARLKFTVRRQTGEVVLEGEAGCYTFQPH